jgi:predicted regulator of Ras-like GTPase activity (Roadblock/LC7/MglB family)
VNNLADAQTVLQQLRQRNPDITAAVLATTDGLAVHSDTAGGADPDALAAMAADVSVRAARMSEDSGQGAARQVLVQSANGHIVVALVGEELCLAVTAKAEASLGLLLISVRKAAGDISTDVV